MKPRTRKPRPLKSLRMIGSETACLVDDLDYDIHLQVDNLNVAAARRLVKWLQSAIAYLEAKGK